MAIERSGLSDKRALDLLDAGVISFNNKKRYYTTIQGDIISLKSSRQHKDGMTYWYGITPQNVNDYKRSNITHLCFIIGYEGVVKIPIELIYKYLENTYTSKYDNGTVKHYHLYLKYQDTELHLYSNADHKFNVNNYIKFEEDIMIEEINEKSLDTLIDEARLFIDFSDQYYIKKGEKKYRNESRVQKERIAAIENHTCQICGFYQEYYTKKGVKRWIIHIDHIIEKAAGGGEQIDNLWALCPNCHSLKTCGIIRIQKREDGRYSVFKNNIMIEFRDKHLNK